MPYLITEKKRCLLSKNQRPVTMIFFRFMQLFQEKTGNSRRLRHYHLPIDKTWVGFGRRDQSHHVHKEGMGSQPYNSVLSQRNRRCHCPMGLNDEETACSLCSFYIDHFIFRRVFCRMTRTSPPLSYLMVSAPDSWMQSGRIYFCFKAR